MRKSNGRVVISSHNRSDGYTVVGVGRRGAGSLLYHRIKFGLHNGWLPKEVDHHDTDKRNDSLDNLRAATKPQNARNIRRKLRGELPRGVYILPSGGFQAKAWDGLRYKHLGTFTNAQEASAEVEAYLKGIHHEFYRTPRKV